MARVTVKEPNPWLLLTWRILETNTYLVNPLAAEATYEIGIQIQCKAILCFDFRVGIMVMMKTVAEYAQCDVGRSKSVPAGCMGVSPGE